MLKKDIFRQFLISFFWILFLTSSCTNSIKQESLYGEWKYIKLEHPNHNPPDNISLKELAEKSPFIRFSEKKEVTIIWGGKKLSQGKFEVEGNIIRITEALPAGKNRKFSFIIRELTDSKLVFETMVNDLTRVTARKVLALPVQPIK